MIVAQNLKVPERSQESKIGENNKHIGLFFLSAEFQTRVITAGLFLMHRKRKFRLEIRSTLWVQSCKTAGGQKLSNILRSWIAHPRDNWC